VEILEQMTQTHLVLVVLVLHPLYLGQVFIMLAAVAARHIQHLLMWLVVVVLVVVVVVRQELSL